MDTRTIGIIGMIVLFVVWFVGVPILIKVAVAMSMKKEQHTQGVLRGFIYKMNTSDSLSTEQLDSYNPNKKNFPVVELEIEGASQLIVSYRPSSSFDDTHIDSSVPLAYSMDSYSGKLRVSLNDEKTIAERKRLWIRGFYFTAGMTIVAIVFVLLRNYALSYF